MSGCHRSAADDIVQQPCLYQHFPGEAMTREFLGVLGLPRRATDPVQVVEQRRSGRVENVVSEFVDDRESGPGRAPMVRIQDMRMGRLEELLVVPVGGAVAPGDPRRGQLMHFDRLEVNLDRRCRILVPQVVEHVSWHERDHLRRDIADVMPRQHGPRATRRQGSGSTHPGAAASLPP